MILREYPSFRALNPIIYTTLPISTNPSSISDINRSQKIIALIRLHTSIIAYQFLVKTKKILIIEALYGLANNQHLARESPLLGSVIHFTN